MRIFLGLAVATSLAACGSTPAENPPTPKALVSLTKVSQGAAPQWVTAYGSAAPAVNGTVTISVPQPGQVTRLLVVAGTKVRAGQTLAVFALNPTASATFEQARTTLATAQNQRATTAQLLSQQLATKDQLAVADKAVADAQAALAGLNAEGAGQPVRPLVAPFDGVVTAVPIAQGDRTQPGAPLVTVARTGDIIASVGVDARYSGDIRVGQPARIVRLNGGPTLAGRVIQASGVLNPRTRLVDVALAFPAGALLPNEALSADIATGQVTGWLVPHRAVVTANGSSHVFQLVGDKAHAVPVTLRLPGDPVDVVDGQLNPNRPLIVAGAYQIADGAAVRWKGHP